MKITKAIIPVAGWGTRRLPITKTIEKAMLPIGNRPIVDFVVEDCIKAGISDIYFVVNSENSQVEQFYSPNEQLEKYLEEKGKFEQIEQIRNVPKGVNFHYVIQPDDGKYGTAIPVALVAEKFEISEPTAILMGDDFIWNEDGSSELDRLLNGVNDDESAMLGVEVPHEEVSKYGVLEMDKANNFVRIVEKPSPENSPSNLINISKYVFSAKLLELTVKYVQNNPNLEGEYMITKPINKFVKSGGVMKVTPARGQYLDGGTLEGWLYANNVVLANLREKKWGNLDQMEVFSERLKMRPIKLSDAENIFKFYNKNVTKFLAHGPNKDLESAKDFVNFSVANIKKGESLNLTVEDKKTGEFLGIAGFITLGNEPEIGLWFKESAQGKGFGIEAVRALVKWATKENSAEFVKYRAAPENIGSWKIAENLIKEFGGEYVGMTKASVNDKDKLVKTYHIRRSN